MIYVICVLFSQLLIYPFQLLIFIQYHLNLPFSFTHLPSVPLNLPLQFTNLCIIIPESLLFIQLLLHFNGCRHYLQSLRLHLTETYILQVAIIDFDSNCPRQGILSLNRPDSHIEAALAEGVQLDALLVDLVHQTELEVVT